MRLSSTLCCALLAVLALPTFAQDKGNIPYVDMSTAQALVDTLVKENETLKAEAAKLRQEVTSLTDQMTVLKKWINDLGPVLAEVKARNADLANVSENLVDRGLKAKSAGAAEKNKAAEKRVAKRIDEMNAQLVVLSKQIETRSYQAAVDDARISHNNDDIVLLQATLSRTKIQEAELQAVLDQINALSTKVDSVLQQSLAAPAPAK